MDRYFRWQAIEPHENGYIIQRVQRTETLYHEGNPSAVTQYDY